MQRKKDFKKISKEMAEVNYLFSREVNRAEVYRHKIQRILTFEKRNEFMKENLSEEDYAAWAAIPSNHTCLEELRQDADYRKYRLDVALHRYEKVQRKKDLENISQEMTELKRNFSIVSQNKVLADKIYNILLFQKVNQFLKENLSEADYISWMLNHLYYYDAANTFPPYIIKDTLAFPEEIRLQQQTLSLQDFNQWKIDNENKYTLYKQLTGHSL